MLTEPTGLPNQAQRHRQFMPGKMSDQLPEDILMQILERLPVKSLLRFRSVSRSWNSLITSQWFINLHLGRSAEAGGDSSILLRQCFVRPPPLVETVHHDNGGFLTEVQEFDSPIKRYDYKHYSYVGACNGLLCFSDYDQDNVKIILWNPSVRTCFQVPAPRFLDEPHFISLGLGFDHRTGQYKVVRLIYAMGEDYKCQIPPKVEVFVLGTDRWRRVNTHAPLLVLLNLPQAFLHGAIHWIGIGFRPDKSWAIAAFDVQEEVFREIEIPGSIIHSKWLSVTMYADSLCLLEEDPWTVNKVILIWVMKQYGVKESWTKQFCIVMEDQGGLRMLGFRKHGEILFVNDYEELFVYDPESGGFERSGLREVGSLFKAIPFVESLVLLKGTGGPVG